MESPCQGIWGALQQNKYNAYSLFDGEDAMGLYKLWTRLKKGEVTHLPFWLPQREGLRFEASSSRLSQWSHLVIKPLAS